MTLIGRDVKPPDRCHSAICRLPHRCDY